MKTHAVEIVLRLSRRVKSGRRFTGKSTEFLRESRRVNTYCDDQATIGFSLSKRKVVSYTNEDAVVVTKSRWPKEKLSEGYVVSKFDNSLTGKDFRLTTFSKEHISPTVWS